MNFGEDTKIGQKCAPAATVIQKACQTTISAHFCQKFENALFTTAFKNTWLAKRMKLKSGVAVF